MNPIREATVNGKKYTLIVPDNDEIFGIRSLTPGDQSRQLEDIKIIKPSFTGEDHPIWFEITVYDEATDNHRILARIQVDKI